MAKKDIMENPVPVSAASKATTDAVLTAFKIGNAMVSLLSGLLASVLILYSGYVLYDSFSTEYKAYSSSWDLLKYKPEVKDVEPSQGADMLAKINEDYRAWLTVYDTSIDYPVLQGTNDYYYAYHDIYRNNSLTGAIYMAAGNARDFSDSYNVIYGHHMDNGAMFGALDKYIRITKDESGAGSQEKNTVVYTRDNVTYIIRGDEEYFRNHQEGLLVTESGVYDLAFFGVAYTDAYEDRIYTPGDRAGDVLAFLTGDRHGDAGIGTTVLLYNEEIARSANKIAALSTCADANTSGRLVVFARMTEHPIHIPTKAPAPTDSATPTPTPTATPTDKATAPPTKKPAAKTTPTPTPKPEKVTLTVKFMVDGQPVLPDQKLIYDPGSEYYVVSPALPGYRPSTEITIGTIENDITIIVTYVPVDYKLTIRYVYLDGKTAAKTYTETLRIGSRYSVNSPSVKGYLPVKEKVSGTNPGRDETYTIVYVPEDEDIKKLYDISDYETPLNLDNVYIQIGVCAE